MKKTLTNPLVLIFLCSFLSVNAQQKADTLWDIAFKKEQVSFAMSLPDGSPILYSPTGSVYGLDPENGVIAWQTNLGSNIGSNDGFKFFSGTPYIEINGYVLNPVNGQKLQLGKWALTTDNKPIHILKSFVFPSKNVILVYGTVKQGITEGSEDQVFSIIDFSSGVTLWTRTDMFKNKDQQVADQKAAQPKKPGLGGLFKQIAIEQTKEVVQKFSDDQNPGERFLTNPVITNKGTLLLPLNLGLYAINITTGDVAWKKEYPSKKKGGVIIKTSDPTTVLTLSKDSSKVYVGKSDFIEAVDVATGNSIWPEPMPSAGPTAFLYLTDKGLLSLPSIKDATILQNKKISLFDAENGSLKWEMKFKYGVKSFLQTGDTIAVNLQNAGDRESVDMFTLSEGKMLFNQHVKLPGNLLNMKSFAGGLLLMGDEQITVINKTTGEIIGKEVNKDKTDNWLTAGTSEALYFMSAGSKKLFKLDYQSGNISNPLSFDIDFEGKERPGRLELYKNNILISSDQNLLYINEKTYNPIYQKYFKAPGKSVGGKILSSFQATTSMLSCLVSATNATLGGMITADYLTDAEAQSFAQLYPEESNKLVEDLVDFTTSNINETVTAAKDVKAHLKEFGKRFKATTYAQDFSYVLSKSEDGDLSILQISKKTGEAVAAIKLRKNDKNPNYIIDEEGKRLYYIPRVTSFDELANEFGASLSKILCLKIK